MAIPALGEAFYNGFTFSEFAETIGMDCTPVLDQSGRVVVYSRVVLTIKDRIVANDYSVGVGAQLEQARLLLQESGGEFRFSGKSFGNLAINSPPGNGTVRDVLWGPHCRGLKHRILGGNQAAEIVWTVELNVPQTCLNPNYQFKLMEVNWRVAWTVDRSAYTTRTISGFIRIPQTRATVDTRTLSDNANLYRRQVLAAFPTPDGFRPGTRSVEVDDSKCRLNFTLVDEELPPNVPPPGVVEVSASHNVTHQGLLTTGVWTGTVSASYEVAKDVDRSLPFFYFASTLNNRVAAAINNATVKGSVQFRSFSMSEPEIHGRKCASFSATYIFTTTLETLLLASGLWTKNEFGDWTAWKTSLASLFSNDATGYASSAHQLPADILVNLCSPSQSILVSGGSTPNPQSGTLTTLSNFIPSPEGSWLDYNLGVLVEFDSETAELKPLPLNPVQPFTATLNAQLGLPPNPPDLGNIGIPGGPGGQIVYNTQGFTPPVNAGATMTSTQQRAEPSMWVSLHGSALRVGYAIPAPGLVSVGDVQPVAANREGEEFYQTQQVANWFGMPVYAAWWKLRWVMPTGPTGDLGVIT